jgi:hypothetical protein
MEGGGGRSLIGPWGVVCGVCGGLLQENNKSNSIFSPPQISLYLVGDNFPTTLPGRGGKLQQANLLPEGGSCQLMG